MSITFEKVLVLKNIPIFEQASEMALADLIAVSEEKIFREKETIISEDSPNGCLYIVLSGRVQLFKNNILISELETRQFFGETTVLNPMPFPCDVIAQERTTVLSISGDALYQMIALHPSLAKGFLGELSRRLHHAQFK